MQQRPVKGEISRATAAQLDPDDEEAETAGGQREGYRIASRRKTPAPQHDRPHVVRDELP